MADERKRELEIGVLRNKQVQERAELEAKLIAELLDSRNRQFDADAKVIKSAEEMVKQAEFELSIMGLSNVERDKAIACASSGDGHRQVNAEIRRAGRGHQQDGDRPRRDAKAD